MGKRRTLTAPNTTKVPTPGDHPFATIEDAVTIGRKLPKMALKKTRGARFGRERTKAAADPNEFRFRRTRVQISRYRSA